jgi:NADPH:quinone reductase-like Zn-dependent oxidoreductase
MKAIQLSSFGDPLEVVHVVDVDPPSAPGPHELRVRVDYAPINPSELLMVRGLYGFRPPLPWGLGQEGVGQLLVAASDVVRVPHDVDPRQLSMARINPPTAALLLSEFVDLQPGEWVVQNAGNSGVGRSVIAFAKARGLKTLSLVRRQELIEPLLAAGADAVLLEGAGIAKRVAQATGGAAIRLAFDGVAGESTAALASCLAPDGMLVAYSGMSGAPGQLNPLHVIFRNIGVRGFWLGHARWRHDPKVVAAVQLAAQLVAQEQLQVPVAAVYGLEQAREAIAHALRGGKVLFRATTAS